MQLPLEKRLAPLKDAPEDSVILHEIYASIQGESTHAGRPCVFVRTTACNLRCKYCDTGHAFLQGKPWKLPDVIAKVRSFGIPLVELTGGEPLLQANVLVLMRELCDQGFEVLLETSGSIDIRPVDPRVRKIVDLKTPKSGEVDANLYEPLHALLPHDEVKLVLWDREDYEWARARLAELKLHERCTVLMGPVWGKLAPDLLAQWIVEDRLPVRMQVQMHKYIWDPKARGV